MQQSVQTTLTGHTTKSGNGQYGPWTLHLFTAANGETYQTGKQDIANAAYALLNQPVTIIFVTKTRGQYRNNKIESVAPAGAGAPLAAPVAQAPVQAAPVAAQADGPRLGYTTPDADAKRIARSVGLEQAINAAAKGVIVINSPSELFDVAHTFGAYVFNGSRPSGATAAPSSSGAVVGATAGAPAPVEAAPVAAPVAAPATDDDIPF